MVSAASEYYFPIKTHNTDPLLDIVMMICKNEPNLLSEVTKL